MRRICIATAGAFCLAAVASQAESAEDGFRPPAIDPSGVLLQTVPLSTGVYALMASRSPVDNVGFVVGSKGVLVVDAHINGRMAEAILKAVRAVTSKPILYLVYTNFHGDHTYGSHRFPAEARVIAHRLTESRMRDGAEEYRLMSALTGWNRGALDPAPPRPPEIIFDGSLTLDLGGVIAELHHFGYGNTPGDTVVYLPESGVAFTGNLILGDGTVPFLLEGGAARYADTLDRMDARIRPKSIVPGHGPMVSGAIVTRYREYLRDLDTRVREAVASGLSLESTAAAVSLRPDFAVAESGLGPSFMATSFHSWNVRAVYDEASGRPILKPQEWRP